MFKNSSGGTTSGRRVVSLQSFEQFMVSFLWSIRAWTMENCRWSICFLQWHLFFVSCEVSRKLREATFFFGCFSFFFFFVFLQLQSPTHCQKCLPMCWDLVLLCPCWGVKLFLWKPKPKQPALPDMLRHFHGLYSHRPWLSTIQRARIHSVIVKTHMAYIRKYFPWSEACHAYSDPKMFWYTLFKRSYASMQDIQVSSSTLPRSGKCFCLIESRENWL